MDQPLLVPRSASPREPQKDARLAGHVPGLDGIRGLAIAMVLALHFVGDADATNGFERVVKRVTAFGDTGVDLFFVLSGFLITGILFDAKDKPGYFRSFYMRRALRIFPLYYAVLAIVFFVLPLVPWLRGPDMDTLQANQAWAWLYGVNILAAVRGQFSMPYLDHFWSLSVEEHFYFVWPLVVWSTGRRALVVLSLLVALASFAARATFAELHAAPVALYVLTPFRLDALCIGAFLAVWARRPGGLDELARAATPVASVAIGLFVSTYLFDHFVTRAIWETLHELRVSLFAVLFAALIVSAITAGETTLLARFFGGRTLRRLGKYSYGLYVFHHFAAAYFIRHKTEYVVAGWVGSHTLAVLLQATVGILASIAVAVASFHYFEAPFLSLKRYWPSARASAAPS